MTLRNISLWMLLAIILLFLPALIAMPIKLIWNASASQPIGLYWITAHDRLAIGDLVIAKPSAELGLYMSERHYLDKDVPLLKTIAAVSGQTICRQNNLISIDGKAVAQALERDKKQQLLPVWQGCQTLKPEQIFLLNTSVNDSFDGRYFGPLPVKTIIGKAVPLFTPPTQ
ncbi:S26 family signal peptidase [Bartonella sp. LJL80]